MHAFENRVPHLSPKDLFDSFPSLQSMDQFRIYNPARVYAQTCVNVPQDRHAVTYLLTLTRSEKFWWYPCHGLNLLHCAWSSYPWQDYLNSVSLSSRVRKEPTDSDMTVSQNMHETALGRGMIRLYIYIYIWEAHRQSLFMSRTIFHIFH